MGLRYRAAAIQFEPELGAKEQNVERLLSLCTAAARAGARLLVTPEMATTGYCWYDRREIAPLVESIPGPTTERFATLAREHHCFIVLGLPEVDSRTGIFYNAAALIGPSGVLGVYRKTHSFISEPKWAKDGDLGFPVFSTELGRLGILICMDADYFEPARLLALQAADVLCFPTNWLLEKGPGAAWIARAFENGCYLIAADRHGCERGVQFSGGSAIIEPDGTIQARLDNGDGYLLGEIELDRARHKRFPGSLAPEKLTARRPEFYDTLTLNAYLWNPLEFHGLYGHRPLPPGRASLIAVAQFLPKPGDLAANLATIDRSLAALPRGTRLAVFPEYAATGVPHDASEATAFAASDTASLLRALRRLARRHRTALVVGFLEALPGGFASSAALVTPSGLTVTYRKTHVIGPERSFLVPGDTPPPVIDLPLGRLGLLIGSDLCFPEIARVLALAGCDLLAVPAGPGIPPVQALGPTSVPLPPPAVTGDDPTHFHLARVRACENMTVVAYAALPLPEGTGWSGLFGPVPESRASERLVEPGQAGLSWGFLDTRNAASRYPTNPLRAKDMLRMRQPYWYAPLQLPIAAPAEGVTLTAQTRDAAREA
jgi:predicted amidohydrolase